MQYADGSKEDAVAVERIRLPEGEVACMCGAQGVSAAGSGSRASSVCLGCAVDRLFRWVCGVQGRVLLMCASELYSGKRELLTPYHLLYCVWQVGQPCIM